MPSKVGKYDSRATLVLGRARDLKTRQVELPKSLGDVETRASLTKGKPRRETASRARKRLGATSVHTREACSHAGIPFGVPRACLLSFLPPFWHPRCVRPKSYRARIRSLYFHSVCTVTTCKIYLYILFMSHAATHVHVYAYILCVCVPSTDNKSSSRQRR